MNIPGDTGKAIIFTVLLKPLLFWLFAGFNVPIIHQPGHITMSTISMPNWQAMMSQPPTQQDDRQTLREVRAARLAVAQAAHFMSAHFHAVDAHGSPQATNPPEALRHVSELAGAFQTLGETVFRLSGKEV